MEAKQGCPPGIKCVIEVAKEYKARGVPIACATSGLKEHVDFHLQHAGILELFEVYKRAFRFCAKCDFHCQY
jgi:hypothetical protein